MTAPYRSAAFKQKAEYSIVQIPWHDHKDFVNALNKSAEHGYRPILMSDSGGSYTVILERWIDTASGDSGQL